MRRTFSVYPKNRITTSVAMFQLPFNNNSNNSFSSEKNNINYSNSRTSFPKSKKIRKMIEEINLTNVNTKKNNCETNNLYNCQKLLAEEKLKNKNYYENIILLNKHINELELQLKTNCHNCQNSNTNDELIKLRQENLELKLFKEKVYSFSKQYDELNNNILNCLKSIEKIVRIYDDNTNENNFEYNNNNLNIISDNFKSIINHLTNFIDAKQEEYNTLLIEKENEIEKLKNGHNYINNDVDNFSNGLRSNRNKNKSYEYNNYYKNYKTNEFDYRNYKRKLEFKNTFDNF